MKFTKTLWLKIPPTRRDHRQDILFVGASEDQAHGVADHQEGNNWSWPASLPRGRHCRQVRNHGWRSCERCMF